MRLLIDDLGSWRLRRRFLAPLIEAGGEVAFFMPVFHVPFRGRANLRNHRKLDRGRRPDRPDRRHEPRLALHRAARARRTCGAISRWSSKGPAVRDLEALFASDWRFATGADPGRAGRPGPDPARNRRSESSVVQVVASGPDVAGDPLYESLLALIFCGPRADLDRHALLRARRDAGPGA